MKRFLMASGSLAAVGAIVLTPAGALAQSVQSSPVNATPVNSGSTGIGSVLGSLFRHLPKPKGPCSGIHLQASYDSSLQNCYNQGAAGSYSALTSYSFTPGTITGAGAQVWVPKADGTLQGFSSGAKLTDAGLTIVPVDGNSQIRSNALTNGAWSATGETTVANSTDVLSPDGTNDLTKVTVSGASARIQSASPWAVTTSQSRVASMVAQPGPSNSNLVILQPSEGNSPFSGGAGVVADVSTCTKSNSFGFGGWSITSTFFIKQANGNCRFGLVYVPDAATTTVYEQINPGITAQSANTGLSAYMGFVQDYPGTAPAPYVSTAAVAASVTADSYTQGCPAACTSNGEVATVTFNNNDITSIVAATSFDMAAPTQPWAGLPIKTISVVPGVVPAIAAGLGYNMVTYSATKFSAGNVDMGCAGGIVAQLYCTGTGTGWGGWGTATSAHSSFTGTDFLVGGGPNQFNGEFATAMFTGGSGTTVKGIVFGKGYVVHATFSLPDILASGNSFTTGWPSFWTLSYELVTTKSPDDTATGLGKCWGFEGDWFEMFLGNFSFPLNQYSSTPNSRYQTGGACFNQTYISDHNEIYTAVPNYTFFRSMHTYDGVWIPATGVANSGHYKSYVDGALVGDVAYSKLTGSETFPPSGAITYSIQDGNFNYPAHYPIIFGSGYISGSATTSGSSISGGNAWTVGTLLTGTIKIGQILDDGGSHIGANSCYVQSLTSGGGGSGSVYAIAGISGTNNPSTTGCPTTVTSQNINTIGHTDSSRLQLHSLVVFQADDSGNIRGN